MWQCASSKNYQFPKDTSAAILTSGLLGEQYIGLEAGGDEKNLKDGDKFKLTQSAMVLGEADRPVPFQQSG